MFFMYAYLVIHCEEMRVNVHQECFKMAPLVPPGDVND